LQSSSELVACWCDFFLSALADLDDSTRFGAVTAYAIIWCASVCVPTVCRVRRVSVLGGRGNTVILLSHTRERVSTVEWRVIRVRMTITMSTEVRAGEGDDDK